MPTYVVLVNWTEQGVAGFAGTTERVDHEAEIRKRAGVELKEIYWTQGPYDLVALIEAPDDESIAANEGSGDVTSALQARTPRGQSRLTSSRARLSKASRRAQQCDHARRQFCRNQRSGALSSMCGRPSDRECKVGICG